MIFCFSLSPLNFGLLKNFVLVGKFMSKDRTKCLKTIFFLGGEFSGKLKF